MTLADYGAVGSFIAGFIAAMGLLYSIVRFIFKVNEMKRALDVLKIIHTPEIINYYKNKKVFTYRQSIVQEKNLELSAKLQAFLDKLEGDTITAIESNRLIQMLKSELAKAKRCRHQDMVIVITTLILLARLLTRKQNTNSML